LQYTKKTGLHGRKTKRELCEILLKSRTGKSIHGLTAHTSRPGREGKWRGKEGSIILKEWV